MQKGFAPPLLILVILIVCGGVGYFLFSSKSIPSKIESTKPSIFSESSKEIYINQNLKFKFEYDKKDLIVKEDSEEEFNKRGNGDFRKNFKGYVTYEPAKVLGIVAVLEKSETYETNPLTIWVFDNSSNKIIDAWYKDYWYYPFVWGDYTSMGKITLAPKDEATVSGQMGKSGVVDYQPGKPKFVYIQSNGKMYLLRVIGDEGEKILKTFEFLDGSSGEIISIPDCTKGPC